VTLEHPYPHLRVALACGDSVKPEGETLSELPAFQLPKKAGDTTLATGTVTSAPTDYLLRIREAVSTVTPPPTLGDSRS
jgi:hypothetical protein